MPQLTSKRRAQILSSSILLIGVAIGIYTQRWFPEGLIVIGISVALRQFLLGRTMDAITSALVFGGIYVSLAYDLNYRIFIPVLLVMVALGLLIKEFFIGQEHPVDKENEDLNHVIEEEDHD